MRALIVDDEDLARAVLAEFLAKHADIDIVGQCANGFDAVKAITELEPDVVFLDIQMPKLNGFEVLELAGSKPRYVFVTAFDQYALKAFEVHAIDYLLKPFNQQRLDQAVAHARTSISSPKAMDELVADVANHNKPLARVLIRDGARVHIIAASKIDYVEAQDDYVQIRSEGKSYLKNQRLSELEEQLEASQFLRVHRSYLLNIERIARIEQYAKDSHNAVLHDGTRIPISRSGYQKVKNLIR